MSCNPPKQIVNKRGLDKPSCGLYYWRNFNEKIFMKTILFEIYS